MRAWIVAIAACSACSLVRDLDGFDDGAATRDGGAGAWCTTNAKGAAFCEDFDTPDALSRLDPTMAQNGSVAVDGASMLVTGQRDREIRASFGKTLAVSGSKATLELDLQLVSANQASPLPAQLAQIAFLGSEHAFAVGLGIYGQTNVLFAYAITDSATDYRDHDDGQAGLADGKVHRIKLVADLGTKRLETFVDGAPGPALALVPATASGRLNLAAGIVYANEGTHDAMTVRVDNVKLDVP